MDNKMKKVYLPVIIFIIFTGLSAYSAGTEWNLAIDREGIKIYTRPVDGFPLDEFRGVTEVRASIVTIEKLLRDVTAQPSWMDNCIEARVLKELGRDHLVCYNVLNVPWPLSDRDLIIDTIIVKDRSGKKISVEMSAFPQDIIPVNRKYVRIREFRARCIVEQISDDTCSIEYINRVNPMAPVPSTIANSLAKNNPFNTLKGMKRMVLLPGYRD